MTLFFIQFNFLDITVPGRVSPKHNILRHIDVSKRVYVIFIIRYYFVSVFVHWWIVLGPWDCILVYKFI